MSDELAEKVNEVSIQSDDEEENNDQEIHKSQKDESNAMEKLAHDDAAGGDEVEALNVKDQNKLKSALAALREQEQADKEAERQRDKELAAVVVCPDDVTVLMEQMELTKSQADRILREQNGDLKKSLAYLIESC